MLMDSVGIKNWDGTQVWPACLCSTMSVALAGKTQLLEARTIWRFILSCLVPGLDVWKPGLSWDCPLKCLHVTSPFGLGSLRAWQSQGSQTYHMARDSKGGCCSDQSGSCMVFCDSLVSYIESLPYSVGYKQQVYSESRRQIEGVSSDVQLFKK